MILFSVIIFSNLCSCQLFSEQILKRLSSNNLSCYLITILFNGYKNYLGISDFI